MCDSTNWLDLHNQSLGIQDLLWAVPGPGTVKTRAALVPSWCGSTSPTTHCKFGNIHTAQCWAVQVSPCCDRSHDESWRGILRALWCSWGTSGLHVGRIHPGQLKLPTTLVSRLLHPRVNRFVCYKVFLLCKHSHVPAGNVSFPKPLSWLLSRGERDTNEKGFPFFFLISN